MDFEDVESLRKELAPYGQEHVLKFWSYLSSDQRSQLFSDIQTVDLDFVESIFKDSVSNKKNNNQKLEEVIEPLPEELHDGVSRCTPELLQAYREAGLCEIAEGNVAVVLLAGGQGTRLGVEYPKGMFDVGLPSRKSLYQLQAERIIRLEELAEQHTGKKGDIPWYIMTSEHTMQQTLEFFKHHNYFGIEKENVKVFEQYMLPCLNDRGKIIMEAPFKMAKAPDGNGGLFRALYLRGILDDIAKRCIKYIHVYCVDNILVKVADPVFLGYCVSKDAECGTKVVEKIIPSEAVGVVCRVKGKFQVIEYSEIPDDIANMKNSDGKLVFNAGSICNHFFTFDFLQEIGRAGKRLKYHVVKKKVPYVGDDGYTVMPMNPNGIKLEKFVFDAFLFSDKFVAWEVPREAEFSPLKNAGEYLPDTPKTARTALFALHRQYIRNAGGQFDDEKPDSEDSSVSAGERKIKVGICEISPLISYEGEGLEFVAGKSFVEPTILSAPYEQLPVSDKNGNSNEE